MTESSAAAEGWYRDPYGIHEDRWFSAGTPTALVRDQGAEGRDEPPDYPPPGPPEELPDEGGFPDDDLRRADEAEARPAAGDLRRADDAEANTGPGDRPSVSDRAFEAEVPGFAIDETER